MNRTERMYTAIRERFPMPDNVRRMAREANRNLYDGPVASEYSFGDCLGVFTEWLDSLPTVYWLPDAAEIADSEPEGEWIDIETGEPIDESDKLEDDCDASRYAWRDPEAFQEIDAETIAEAHGFKMLYSYR